MGIGSVIHNDELTGADIHVAYFIGKQVALKPGFIYGTIEAVKLGSNPAVKISGDWYEFKQHHLVLLSE